MNVLLIEYFMSEEDITLGISFGCELIWIKDWPFVEGTVDTLEYTGELALLLGTL